MAHRIQDQSISRKRLVLAAALSVVALSGLGLIGFLLLRDGGAEPLVFASPTVTVTATAEPTVTAEPTASPTSSPIPTPRRSGIAEIDTILDAIFSGDPDAVAALISYTTFFCVTELTGLGGPPLCLPGEADGTPVDVFPAAECEGHYVRPERMERTLRTMASPEKELYAIYRSEGLTWPPGEYVAIVSPASEKAFARGLAIADGRIVGFNWGCAQTPAQFVEFWELTDAVLPPLPTPTPPP